MSLLLVYWPLINSRSQYPWIQVRPNQLISTSPSASGRGAPLTTEFTSSLLTSEDICGCGCTRTTSSKASFWSGVKSDAYLCDWSQNFFPSRCGFTLTFDRTQVNSGAIRRATSLHLRDFLPCMYLTIGWNGTPNHQPPWKEAHISCPTEHE
jgi:hypothetical protein